MRFMRRSMWLSSAGFSCHSHCSQAYSWRKEGSGCIALLLAPPDVRAIHAASTSSFRCDMEPTLQSGIALFLALALPTFPLRAALCSSVFRFLPMLWAMDVCGEQYVCGQTIGFFSVPYLLHRSKNVSNGLTRFCTGSHAHTHIHISGTNAACAHVRAVPLLQSRFGRLGCDDGVLGRPSCVLRAFAGSSRRRQQEEAHRKGF